MIIAVNTRLLIPDKLEGIGRFTVETLRIITARHPEHKFIFIFDRKFADEFIFSSNITPVICHPQARHPLLWYLFFEHSVPEMLRKCKADLFFSPDGWLSLKSPVKSLPVIHDLNFFHFPQYIPFPVRQYYNYFFPRFVQKACRIATVSEFTGNDIAERFDFSRDKIDVVYNGAEGFSPVDEETRQAIRNKYTHGDPYFVFIGLIHPRKNLTNLMVAFDRFKKETPDRVKLLVVGARKWWTNDMETAYNQCSFRDEIIFTGRVDDNELKKLTASAIGLTYISFFEGFGIPVLEAMYCDTPVLCSAGSSMPEVGGNAVLYADPSDPDSIKAGMIAIYKDENLRNSLISKSRLQREKFSWNKTAELLWGSIEKCL
jgi:glycosyltransferase involved in cell wall biosynthesis